MVKNAATRLNVRLRNQRRLILMSVVAGLKRSGTGSVEGIEDVALAKPAVRVNEDNCTDICESKLFVVLAESGCSD